MMKKGWSARFSRAGLSKLNIFRLFSSSKKKAHGKGGAGHASTHDAKRNGDDGDGDDDNDDEPLGKKLLYLSFSLAYIISLSILLRMDERYKIYEMFQEVLLE